MKKSFILLAGFAALCAVPAFAEIQSVPVSFAGLDLTSTSGKATLDRRVRQAVRTICGSPDIRDLSAVSATNRCTTETMTLAQRRVDIAIAAAQPVVQVAAVR